MNRPGPEPRNGIHAAVASACSSCASTAHPAAGSVGGGRVWLIDAGRMSRVTGSGQIFEEGILPLAALCRVHSRPTDPAAFPAAPGDALFLFVEGRAVVGFGRVTAGAPDPVSGNLAVVWDLNFARALPRRAQWVAGEFPWDSSMQLFHLDGSVITPFAQPDAPLWMELSGSDILALVRWGEAY